jgi:two-component system KDP operon response regulator KdpE
MNRPEILIIDDEPQIRKLLRITLESNDYAVNEAASAKEGLVMAANHPPALILLDLGLPDKNGHLVLKELKHWFTHPVIILSVNDNEEDIIYALDNGADDYLVKPFRTGELLARIRTALRKETKETDPVIKTGDLIIDLSLRIVRKKDEQLKLTSTEYNLLALLAKNEGRVLTHRHLLKEIWGPGHESESQYLRVFIAQLRKKIEDNPNEPAIIITEPGVGYRFISKE